ncbi:hypothetical protein [Mycobacterium sp. OTB74]|uniref:hypothetical protein n=1 Tax=Mycobacterium sp. OTB74 TaxID=1853452 RepID=UPI002474C976|nr:hypothetical protein [Mycobacterium sp. OTB74]
MFDEFRESDRAGQHAAAEAWRQFNKALDEAIPEAVHPLRAKITDAAISLADTLVTAQYQFHRNLIRSTDRALNPTHVDHKKDNRKKKSSP